MVFFLVAMKTQMKKPDVERSPCDSKSSVEDKADLFSVTKKEKKQQRSNFIQLTYKKKNPFINNQIIGCDYFTLL